VILVHLVMVRIHVLHLMEVLVFVIPQIILIIILIWVEIKRRYDKEV